MTLAAFLRHLGFAVAPNRPVGRNRPPDDRRPGDGPPEARKAHDRPTPKGGGVGIVVAFLVGITVLYRYAEFARLADPYFLGVIEASLAIAVVAFLDDLFDWPFTVKLGAQVLAALVAVAAGSTCATSASPTSAPSTRLGRHRRRRWSGSCSPPTR